MSESAGLQLATVPCRRMGGICKDTISPIGSPLSSPGPEAVVAVLRQEHKSRRAPAYSKRSHICQCRLAWLDTAQGSGQGWVQQLADRRCNAQQHSKTYFSLRTGRPQTPRTMPLRGN